MSTETKSEVVMAWIIRRIGKVSEEDQVALVRDIADQIAEDFLKLQETMGGPSETQSLRFAGIVACPQCHCRGTVYIRDAGQQECPKCGGARYVRMREA